MQFYMAADLKLVTWTFKHVVKLVTLHTSTKLIQYYRRVNATFHTKYKTSTGKLNKACLSLLLQKLIILQDF